jgi:Na+/proline symporter/two-component sensor histidine kinase
MFSPLFVVAAMFAYIALLFILAQLAERTGRGRSLANHPSTYALALTVYCTTWTYYGSVGRATTGGMGFLPVYLGPTLALLVGGSVFRKIALLKHSHRITSIADFISTRFGKSRAVAALVTGLLTIGILPYIALQLKAANRTFGMLVAGGDAENTVLAQSFGPISAALMIVFTIVFGIRHLDPTQRHPGMLLSLGAEAFVKLTAFLAAGGFVIGAAFQGYSGFERALAEIEPATLPLFGQSSASDTLTYVVVMLLSAAAFAFLPRQFHVGIVENHRPDDIRTAQWLTPLYLLLINLFVLPIALGGQVLAASDASADFYVLALPLAAGKAGLSLAVFLGGFSAAIGMVMIESMAMATMIANHLLLPAAERLPSLHFLRRYMLFMRWGAAACFILGGYLFAEQIGDAYPLVSIGLISFAAAFVLAPVALLGLYWRGANRAGALLGLSAGASVWFYTLMLPTFVRAGWLPSSLLSEGAFGLSLLRPEALFGWAGLPSLAHGVIWSSAATLVGLLGGSALFQPSTEETLLCEAFLGDAREQLEHLDNSKASIELAQQLLGFRQALSSYFAQAETERLLQRALEKAGCRGRTWMTLAQSAAFAFELERMLAGALGAASAHRLMKILAPFERKSKATSQQQLRLALAGPTLPGATNAHLSASPGRESALALALAERNEELTERTRQLRSIVDHVAFGLLTVDPDMIVQPGYSLSCHALLETEAIAGRRLGDILQLAPMLDERYELCVRDACAGWPPDETALEDAPQLFQTTSGRTLRIQPRLLPGDSRSTLVLMTISDVSELTRARNAEQTYRMLLGIVQRKPAFEQFLEQAWEQLRKARLRLTSDSGFVRRVLRSLGRQATSFGMAPVVQLIGEIDAQPKIGLADLDAIVEAFRELLRAHSAILGVSVDGISSPSSALSQENVERPRAAAPMSGEAEPGSLDSSLRDIQKVTALDLLGPIEQMVASLSERSGKKVGLEIHGADVRVDRSQMANLFNAVPHLIRNVFEHGIEPPDARQTKPEIASLVLEIVETDETYIVAVQDDGRGIDAESVARAAVSRGVVTEATARLMSESAVVRLVFRERLSTAATANDGVERGFGLSAVQAEVRHLGGQIAILTKVGSGTRVEITIPKAARPASKGQTQPPPRQTRPA